ncbi:inverse autotransporter beta domain-containing protein [Oryzomicrobium sp.]|uniref:inverse autotransporter beta domain-containing protein n=1 Tax=Oryzomicrobium sp. TaxID=1911578 RepID=UPI002FE2A92E
MSLLCRAIFDSTARPAVSLCLAAFAMAATAQDGAAQWLPHLDFEGKLGNKRNIGEADFFLPIAQDARTLYFANVRTRFDSESGREGNLGLGVRHMLENGWNLGTYGYFDRRRSSDTGYYYNQTTLGVEALGRDVDLRANAYVPVGTRTHDLGSTSTAALSGSTVQVTTTNREERSLQGFDAEAGWRLPIFDSEARRQLRVYAGGYHFSMAGITVEGPRARAELAFEDLGWFGRGTALFVGAEAQHDHARGSQQFFSVRLRIPLGKADEARSPLSAQARRMVAPVVRDVDVVTQRRVSTQMESVDAATASNAVTLDGKAVTLVNSATTTGANLQNALDAAGNNSTVVLAGRFDTTAPLTLKPGQSLIGLGNLTVTTPSGHSVTLAAPGATLASTLSPPNLGSQASVTMASGSTLRGMTINAANTAANGANTWVYGIDANGVSGVVIAGNTVTATSPVASAIALRLNNTTNATVTGNSLTAINTNVGGGSGIALQLLTNSTALVSGNTLSGQGVGASIALHISSSTPLPGSTGNTVLAGSCSSSGSGGTIGYVDAGGVAHSCP